ncbi:hypothetical protein LshimejAT787_0900120 [Lyophyllum shimeji]|uniref:Fruit-body specific protein a n=1 Tax=Lyophyllum shimeji TaxID=47721 RepID=A0A9P3UQ08_LYOSH|nr:hypothetical protein LshimejAT787_0900120 [Lyophyllum shimeji]
MPDQGLYADTRTCLPLPIQAPEPSRAVEGGSKAAQLWKASPQSSHRWTFPSPKMQPLSSLLTVTLLAITVNAATTGIVPPSQRGIPGSFTTVDLDLNGTTTDNSNIASTVPLVDQKGGATNDAPPNQPVPETTVTAVDGQVVDANTTVTALTGNANIRRTSDLTKRLVPGYEQVFDGTGTLEKDRDGSIEGTAYLTYTVVSNATYDIDACLNFCNRVEGCVFANLYYEFNNYLLDFVFSEQSNLKCAVYGDIHAAAEKTNRGGQQLIPPPAGLTYIQQSSGWAAKTLADPADPEGYEIVFGPTNGANNAPGYMGFAFIDKYDVNACAALCNTRGSDRVGGACQYFNIWRAVVNGVPTTYTCSFYYIVADESTAVNYGQGDLKVTYSRGYKRKTLTVDSGFEGYTCPNGDEFCFGTSSSAWVGTSPTGGSLDATIFHYAPYTRSGSSVALLGSASGVDALAGTLAPKNPLNTVAGRKYSITFFHQSTYSGQDAEKDAFVDVLWNGAIVQTIKPGYQDWTFYEFTVTAVGNDKLAFHGGKAPAWSFIDDVNVWPL